MKKKVLVLCTGNSCRSQMAEAIVNARLGEKWIAISAGTRPAGFIHPLAIEVLQEIGINHSGESKPVDIFYETSFDLVVTVCDSAAEGMPGLARKRKKGSPQFPGSREDRGYYRFSVGSGCNCSYEIPQILIKYE